MAARLHKTLQSGWHSLKLSTGSFTELRAVNKHMQSSYKSWKSICSAESLDKSLLRVVLRMTELQSWWVPVTTPTSAVSLMISNPSSSVGSKIHRKYRERRLSPEEGNKFFGVSHPAVEGSTKGKKGENQTNSFCSFFIRTAKLFCIKEMFLC